MPSTHAPKMTESKERIDIGSPEKGARMTKTPRRMRMLVRDIRSSISGRHNDDKFAADSVGMRGKMSE